ncbi:bifunctional lysylphosphatidylglycerol flippase/synthetase MprF [Rhizobium sp. C1]|uniref:bifunctional lysylphosphatidylglycerol flippase/synthetase MprF n=1 Tax=Rhizobium sp. C1 TaxID=1349799 RepID=UPI001E2BCA47|nr:bifunctional lysylphosphatidylglycerol flippase/synthetase MprF [Rhizobium sp. C1]MCD2177734.1 bifunctional lysylphosphatidylglycerol flippase/synthetase MprF [Rhizobium sp. C1]
MTPATETEKNVDEERKGGVFRLLYLFERYREYLLLAAILAVSSLTAYAIYSLTREIRIEDVRDALAATPLSAILLSLLFTALSFVAMIAYDINAIDYVRKEKLPLVSVAITSFTAYAVGNTAGFGALSAGAIRLRAYLRLGLTPEEIAKIIAFVTLAFGLGILMVTALSVLVTAPRLAALSGIDAQVIRAIATAVIVVMAVLLYIGRDGRRISIGFLTVRLPDSKTASRQFLVSALDMAAAATALYVLIPQNAVGWPTFFAIYSTAVGLGLLSHVPAGIGIFEAVMVSALGSNVDVDRILGSLLLYRLIYNVLPLLVAALALILAETRRFALVPVAAAFRQLEPRLAPALISALSVVTGAILIFSSVTPTNDDKLVRLENYMPVSIVESAHFVTSLLGLALFIAARGLSNRLDAAWWFTLATSVAALFFANLRGVSPLEASLLVVLIMTLSMTHRRFKRPASLIHQVLAPSWVAAMAVIVASAVTLLFFVYRDVDYSDSLWWEFEIADEVPRGLRAAAGLALAASAVAIYSLLRPAKSRPQLPTGDALDKALPIVMAGGAADANLVRMGDKQVLLSDSGKCFIMYGIQGRSWVALFDPVGDEEEAQELLWRFVEMAQAAGARAVLYQITPALLGFCADAGLRAYKLGEAATVSLPDFQLKGGRMANLRQTISKAQREDLEFHVAAAGAEVDAIMDELQAVSDSWLQQHDTREKTFSLGSFDPAYIRSQPVALLKQHGRIVAFATLLVTDAKIEGSVDLMRFVPDAPKGSMDFLFVRIIEYLRDEDFQSFNLGMAPLSGMSRRESAPVWDRIGGVIFEHAERFYNFKGLKAYKSKFAPRWEARYIAVSGNASPVMAIMDVTVLIGGGLRGVVGK